MTEYIDESNTMMSTRLGIDSVNAYNIRYLRQFNWWNQKREDDLADKIKQNKHFYILAVLSEEENKDVKEANRKNRVKWFKNKVMDDARKIIPDVTEKQVLESYKLFYTIRASYEVVDSCGLWLEWEEESK